MKVKQILFKTISVFLILSLLFLNSVPVLSQELEATPTPTDVSPTATMTPEPTDGPTPTDNPQLTSEDQNSIDETQIYTYGDPTTATGSSIASDSALLDLRVENNNDTTVTRNTIVDNSSGTNSVSDNISLSGPIILTTGDSESRATIATVVNTNIVGLNVQPIIHNLYTPQNANLDLSGIESCQAFDASFAGDIEFNENTGNTVKLLTSQEIESNIGVYNTNKAEVVNNVTLDANTGDNQATDNIGIGVHVETGDATSTAYLANIANTNLVGNCGLFAVINIFEGGTGSLILPNEMGYLSAGQNTDITSQENKNLLIDYGATNSANLTTQITTNTKTGENTITDAIAIDGQIGINTGDNLSQLETIDMANLNFIDSDFIYLRINHNGHFMGNIIGWDGELLEFEDYFVLYKKKAPNAISLASETQSIFENTGDGLNATESGQFDQILDVDAVNDATINNQIALSASTGNNSAGRFGATIDTGDATARAGILNLANTNVIGNNWYVAFVNLFDDFFGDIIFFRPPTPTPTPTSGPTPGNLSTSPENSTSSLIPTPTVTNNITQAFTTFSNKKTNYKKIVSTKKKPKILGIKVKKTPTPSVSPQKYGSILDGISTNTSKLLLIAIVSYIFGFISGVATTKRRLKSNTWR